jgi:hypothetical protein
MLFLVRRTSYLGKQSIYCLDQTFNQDGRLYVGAILSLYSLGGGPPRATTSTEHHDSFAFHLTSAGFLVRLPDVS